MQSHIRLSHRLSFGMLGATLLAHGCAEERRDMALSGDDGGIASGHTTTASNESVGGDDAPGDGGLKLDVASTPEDPCADGSCADEGCTSVDLLFVIDNSTSMGDYQAALGQAFPAFADAIVEALPSGVSLHVGVTSTEMGFASSGTTQTCTAPAAGNYYETPDNGSSGRNGAQGRLYVAGGRPYFEIDTNASAAELEELERWFTEAANIGEGGSNIEMSLAAAAWATDPANAKANEGFLRDEGSVLVVFFIQDEPDQTPRAFTDELVDKIARAKQGCGGLDCVIAGGFVNQYCLDPIAPESPVALASLFSAVPEPAVLATLPNDEDDVTPAHFEEVLRDTLAKVIAEKCDEIKPVG